MKPFFKQYENGLRLIFKKVEANRPASLFIAVDVGSSKEDEKTSGISHFIEHLNFKGTEKRTAKQISTELEEIGANANAFTSKSTTCFFATCLGEKIEQCFDILTDMVFNSKYNPSDIQKERQVIFEEIDMYDDDPESVAYEQFCKDFYFGSPLQRPIIGTKESLEGITKKDIEEYVATHYVPQNIVVSVVGDFNKTFVEGLVKKYINKHFTKKAEVVEKNKSMIIIPDKKFSYLKEIDDIVRGYIAYEEELKLNNALDFDDLLMKVLILFEESPSVLDYYQELFKYILVDEFQDTNTIQYKLVKMLSAKHGNIFVVGDEDQCIYGWRGANIDNIRNFIKEFEDDAIIIQEKYRKQTHNYAYWKGDPCVL